MEKAILISAVTPDITEFQANEYLDELEFLAMTASIEGVKRFLQRIDKPNSSGQGQASGDKGIHRPERDTSGRVRR